MNALFESQEKTLKSKEIAENVLQILKLLNCVKLSGFKYFPEVDSVVAFIFENVYLDNQRQFVQFFNFI